MDLISDHRLSQSVIGFRIQGNTVRLEDVTKLWFTETDSYIVDDCKVATSDLGFCSVFMKIQEQKTFSSKKDTTVKNKLQKK